MMSQWKHFKERRACLGWQFENRDHHDREIMAAGAWSRWLQCIYCLVTMYLPSGSRERWKVGAHLAFSFHPAWNSHPVYGMAPLTGQVSLYTSMNVIYVILHSLSRSLSLSWCSTLLNWQSVLPIMITIRSLRHLQWKHLKFFFKKKY